MKKFIVCVLAGAGFLLSAFAADWPQFCGPNRNNVSDETGLADQWPESGPKVLWEVPVFNGYSGPAIKDGKVYLIDRDGENSLLRCLNLEDGKELWVCSFADPGQMKGKKFEGTRGTPTVTEDAVYLVTGYGMFACIDLTTHGVKWIKNLLTDYDNLLDEFGIAQSPFIHGNLVLVSPNAAKAGVAAYDKVSGERVWVSSGMGIHSFVSPQVVTLCGREMVVAAGSARKPSRKRSETEETPPVEGHVVGLSIEDGSVLWETTGWQCKNAIPFPVPVEGDRLFLTGGYDVESVMIQIEKTDTGYAAKELFRTDVVGAQIHQPIQVGNHLFIESNSNSRKDGLACLSLDGKLEWRTKDIDGAPNFDRGSFILADGKLILLDGESGILYLVKADVSGYRQLASAKMVKEKDMAWAPLALSGGKLLVRDWNTMKCVELK
ncbi:MAG: PQQ-binding-like beta-propeller repeat protein [Pontiellaceae bacterium]|jgi:hypothetical protein|nr:PQQ-binding-like beta-propeller repeat protein [Pontiellaceae bacterium]